MLYTLRNTQYAIRNTQYAIRNTQYVASGLDQYHILCLPKHHLYKIRLTIRHANPFGAIPPLKLSAHFQIPFLATG